MRYKNLLVRGGYKLISDDEYEDVINNRILYIPKNCRYTTNKVNNIRYSEFIILGDKK